MVNKSYTALANDLESALLGLAKLSKALSFYPQGHPALLTAADETEEAFQPLLTRHEIRPYYVSAEGFQLDASPLTSPNENLQKLAQLLVERQVRQLLFLADLNSHELLMFTEELARPVPEIILNGGLSRMLAQRHIETIKINQTVQSPAALNRTGDPSMPDEASIAGIPSQADSVTGQVRELLELLKEPLTDERYSQLLERIKELARDFFAATGVTGILTLFNLLEAHRHDVNRCTPQRELANRLTDELLTEQMQKQLVDLVAERHLKPSHQRVLARILVGLKMKIAPLLLERLFAERDAIVRRLYTTILAKMGTSLFGLLEKALNHDRWYVTRNVINVLGETHSEEALPLLLTNLDHPEARVRRALIRALGALDSSAVIPHLLTLAQDEDPELHQPAIIALGALGKAEAIPPMVRFLQKQDPVGKQTTVKTEIIRAFAAIKSPRAIPPLLKIARKLNFLNRKPVETLRAEAILALGQLGNRHLIPVLNQLPKTTKGPAGRALQQAISQLKKQQPISKRPFVADKIQTIICHSETDAAKE